MPEKTRESVIINHADLTQLSTDILVAANVSRNEAERVAARLVGADLTDHSSHGVGRLPRYVQMLEQGLVFAGRTISIVTQSEAHLVLDGNAGFGQAIGEDAVRAGCAHAARHGVAVVGLRNSGHLGRIGDWAEMAAEAGYVSIHMVSVRGRSLVAPYGGIDRRLATSPFAAGVPITGSAPLVLDFATSAVSEGKALMAAKGGTPLPPGSLISPEGLPSHDPSDLYGSTVNEPVPNASIGSGALAAFGGHKGSGLSFMIEILAGALTGTGVNRTHFDGEEKPFRNGMLSIYLDPDRFAGRDYLESEARNWAVYLRSARPAVGHDAVLIPGEQETRHRANRIKNGVPLTGQAWQGLVRLAEGLGLNTDDYAATVRTEPSPDS